ncbi:hypothetical protein C3747_220g101 [Trypanosoma cruzi]|uniref:Uncharacterized protein n=1 Tax=Trypanosoma cruzi TaxID=5693 RepID=A0A2V2VVJ3_TRYCR|nr:hypothetical protein C3747_220g102 [Trypanosoma cruzi]PWU99258.1 hypothetical protein C3747_220g101 [Trypanosoma cruzi]
MPQSSQGQAKHTRDGGSGGAQRLKWNGSSWVKVLHVSAADTQARRLDKRFPSLLVHHAGQQTAAEAAARRQGKKRPHRPARTHYISCCLTHHRRTATPTADGGSGTRNKRVTHSRVSEEAKWIRSSLAALRQFVRPCSHHSTRAGRGKWKGGSGEGERGERPSALALGS